jgi:hypothetical protein
MGGGPLPPRLPPPCAAEVLALGKSPVAGDEMEEAWFLSAAMFPFPFAEPGKVPWTLGVAYN